MLKAMILIIYILYTLSPVSANTNNFLIESPFHQIKLISANEQIVFSGPHYRGEITVKKCSRLAIDLFLKKIQKKQEKAISFKFKDKKSIMIRINNREINTTPNSFFSNYISNLQDKFVTLKKQVLLSCKK